MSKKSKKLIEKLVKKIGGFINAACGLIVIEVRESNPNGDPDCSGEPRMKPGEDIGLISDVSIKRKIRDLMLYKDGPVYQKIAGDLKLEDDKYDVFEARGRDFAKVEKMTTEDVLNQYWDCRVFGTNFLSKKGSHINSGAVQFGLGTSIAPVKLLSFTHTKCCGAEAGLDRGMAPKGYKVVQHGLYAIPFFVNPTSAKKSNCTETDIEVFKRLIPYIFTHSISRSRNRVSIQNAWYVDLGSPLGCFNPVSIVDQLTPTKKTDPGVPSSSISEYTIPLALPKEASKSGATLQSLV